MFCSFKNWYFKFEIRKKEAFKELKSKKDKNVYHFDLLNFFGTVVLQNEFACESVVITINKFNKRMITPKATYK